MAALDPAALERELEALRRQRFEASQRVRASRQPLPGPATQGRNAAGETALGSGRLPLGNGRFGADRGFGGPPPLRTDGLRAAGSFREGPPSSRLGSGPSPRGPPGAGFHDGPPRGRFEGGPGSRGSRDLGEHGRDRDRGGETVATAGANAPAAPPRRRALLSMVVTDRPAPRDEPEEDTDKMHRHDDDGEHDQHRDRNGNRDTERGRDLDSGRHRQDDRQRGWGRGGGGAEEDRHRGEDGYGHDHRYGSSGTRGVKRPAGDVGPPGGGAGGAQVAEDPDSRKRARRLLGRALLGTLQKFRQEDAQFQASDAAARRAELARKAEEKAAAEAERLRRQAAEERSRKRQEELEALMDLNLATDIKVLELLYAKKLARRRALAVFLRADGAGAGGKGVNSSVHFQPQPVYWMPAKHCEATLALKERQQKELRDWEEAVLADLELDKEGLRMRAQARRQGIAERRQRAAEARAEGREAAGGAAAAGGEEEEDEDHEAFEAVELDAHHDDEEVDEQREALEVEARGASDGGAEGEGVGGESAARKGQRSSERAGAKEVPDAEVADAAAGARGAEADAEAEAKVDAMETEAKAVAVRDDSDSGAGDDVVA